MNVIQLFVHGIEIHKESLSELEVECGEWFI